MGTKIVPGRDTVEYRRKKLESVRTLEYFAYHKPRGPVVTRFDPHATETIYDALRKNGFQADHLRYVGRLDRDSEGLLLMTNDGTMIHALTHPRFAIKKVYRVQTEKQLDESTIARLVREGVQSEDQVLKAGAIRPLPPDQAPTPNRCWYEVDLFEGKKRQIRRMFEGCGFPVTRLIRVQFGSVKLHDLAEGAIRPLTEREKGGLQATGYPVRRS